MRPGDDERVGDTASARVAQLRRDLHEHGYALLRGAGNALLVEVLEALGRVLHVEEIVVDASSVSLVKSSGGLSLHTDHHRADEIVWYCIAQSDEGGASLLADGHAAYAALSPAQQRALGSVMLQEHSVFRGDAERYPLVSERQGRLRLYYSYWLADARLSDEQRGALDALEAAVQRGPRIELRLTPGDILAIDNGRMLHGRSAIEGSKARHLRRYWIEDTSR